MSVTSESGFHTFGKTGKSSISLISIIVFLVVILLGIISGYFLAQNTHKSVSLGGTTPVSGLKVGDVVGSNDTSVFKDSAEGTLQTGGINNEGQYHLVRPGGDSQNVYLTSSSVDLLQFVNHKIKVWGATQTAKTAGWLMDVGRVEVLQ